MKRLAFLLIAVSGLGFAQSTVTPDGAGTQPARPNIWISPKLFFPGPGRKLLQLRSFPPGLGSVNSPVCAIQLLRAPLAETEKMRVLEPFVDPGQLETEVKPPAPACDEALSRDK